MVTVSGNGKLKRLIKEAGNKLVTNYRVVDEKIETLDRSFFLKDDEKVVVETASKEVKIK